MRVTSLLLLAAVGLLTVLLLVPLPAMRREWKALGDLLHFALFALLTGAVLRWAPPRATSHTPRRTLLLLVLVAVFAYGTEKLQSLSGREPSRHDFLADLAGAAAAALIVPLRVVRGRRRWALSAALGGLIAAAAYHPLGVMYDSWLALHEMPELSSFENRWQATRWRFDFARGERRADHATRGRYSLRIELLPGRYSAATLTPPVADWHEFRELRCDVELLGNESLDVALKIYDQPHTQTDYSPTDRFQHRLRLQPGRNHLRVSLDDVRRAPQRRSMDLAQIVCFQLFTWDLVRPRVVYLDDVRLVR